MLFPACISATEFDHLLQGPRWTGHGKSPWNMHRRDRLNHPYRLRCCLLYQKSSLSMIYNICIYIYHIIYINHIIYISYYIYISLYIYIYIILYKYIYIYVYIIPSRYSIDMREALPEAARTSAQKPSSGRSRQGNWRTGLKGLKSLKRQRAKCCSLLGDLDYITLGSAILYITIRYNKVYII